MESPAESCALDKGRDGPGAEVSPGMFCPRCLGWSRLQRWKEVPIPAATKDRDWAGIAGGSRALKAQEALIFPRT